MNIALNFPKLCPGKGQPLNFKMPKPRPSIPDGHQQRFSFTYDRLNKTIH